MDIEIMKKFSYLLIQSPDINNAIGVYLSGVEFFTLYKEEIKDEAENNIF